MVIAGEVGGRWSDETKTFLWSLACAKAMSVARRMHGLVQEVDMPLGLLFSEGGGLLPSGQGGSRCADAQFLVQRACLGWGCDCVKKKK